MQNLNKMQYFAHCYEKMQNLKTIYNVYVFLHEKVSNGRKYK